MAFLFNLKHLFNGVDVDNLINEIDSLKKELYSAKKLLSENSMLLAEKNKELASLKQLNEALTEDMVREKDMCTILDGKIKDINQTITELMKDKEILDSSEQKLKDECKKVTKSNASLNAKNMALTSELEKKTSNWSLFIQDYNQKYLRETLQFLRLGQIMTTSCLSITIRKEK